MTLRPTQSGVFNLSDVTYDADRKGAPIRGFGSDSSEKYTDYIYIGSLLSQRTIMFKGFVDAYKLNVDKKLDKKDEADKNYTIYVPGVSKMSWNITIHVPAHSINESVNNLGKISELMKMIQPGPQDGDGASFTSLVYVFYKNLISSADSSMSHKLNRYKGFEELIYKGVSCYVEDVSFKPELDFGTFILNSKKYPKLYSINLTLNLENNPESIVTSVYGSLGASIAPNYINSFNCFGEYIIESDRIITPFGVRVGDAVKNREFTQKQMNTFSDSIGSDFMFISLPYYIDSQYTSQDSNGNIQKLGKNIERKFVVFRTFMESFNNSSKANVTVKETQSTEDNPMRTEFQSVVFSDWSYDVTLNIPFKNIEESKKELAKIQYLIRMFFTKNNRSATEAATLLKFSTQNINGFNRSKIKVLLPGYIQVPGSKADKFKYSYSNNFKYLKSSLAAEFTKLSMEFDSEMGFWRDDSGRLYPKAIKLEMSFSLDSNELTANYERVDSLDATGKITGFKYKGLDHSVPTDPGARNIYNNPNDAANKFPYGLNIINPEKKYSIRATSEPAVPSDGNAGPFGRIGGNREQERRAAENRKNAASLQTPGWIPYPFNQSPDASEIYYSNMILQGRINELNQAKGHYDSTIDISAPPPDFDLSKIFPERNE